MINPFSDEYFMKKALLEAQTAYDLGEVPIGAVIVANDTIIAKGHNLTERLNDVTAHAEIQCITAASENLGGKYLKGCTLYVTVEPCLMCSGALYWSQISRVVFGAWDKKRGASRYENTYHPSTEVIGGVLAHEAEGLMQAFFRERR